MLEGVVVQRWNEALLTEALTMPIPPPAATGSDAGREAANAAGATAPSLAQKVEHAMRDGKLPRKPLPAPLPEGPGSQH
jgi:hypothetical protein